MSACGLAPRFWPLRHPNADPMRRQVVAVESAKPGPATQFPALGRELLFPKWCQSAATVVVTAPKNQEEVSS
jgi:hypothetical protein